MGTCKEGMQTTLKPNVVTQFRGLSTLSAVKGQGENSPPVQRQSESRRAVAPRTVEVPSSDDSDNALRQH